MKQIIVALSLIALCAQHTFFAMDMSNIFDIELKPINKTNQQITQTNQSTTKPDSLDDIITRIDTEINEKYPRPFTSFFSTKLTEENYFDIMNIITKHSATPTRDLLIKLYWKNNHYQNAADYFYTLACKNRDNVTIDTLETIQNPTLLQPTVKLNQLPLTIKAFIMNISYNKLNDEYDIILTGHTDSINYFDICTATHQAATSSQDKTLRLWSLLTGKLIHTFPEDNASTIFCIAFNTDGSLLATADRPDGSYHAGSYGPSAKVNNIIKIWSTESAQLLHSMQHNTEIRSLCYTNNDLLVLCNYTRYYDSNIEIISANKDSMKILATTTKKHTFGHGAGVDYVIWNNMYKTLKSDYGYVKQALTVTKLHCRPLHLYERSIENIRDVSSNIETAPLFQKFTEYEQDMLRTKQTKKIESLIQAAALLAANQQQTQTNNLLINQ